MVKNRNLSLKLKFWSKIEMLAKHQNFGKQNQNFGHTSKCWLKNRNFSQKLKFLNLKEMIFSQQTWEKYFWKILVQNLFFNSQALIFDRAPGALLGRSGPSLFNCQFIGSREVKRKRLVWKNICLKSKINKLRPPTLVKFQYNYVRMMPG